MEPQYRIGQLVFLRADPTRRGPIIEVLSPIGGHLRYRVFHSDGLTPDYYQDQLEPIEVSRAEDPISRLIRGDVLTANEFRARLSAIRLAHRLVDNLYALHAARIQFIPFQFKPLVRFLRADQPRLLIADEVGVGKTIEAGLILKELKARQSVDRVLVLCPKALVLKWQVELRRFDENFRILTSEGLQYCLRETYRDGVWPEEYRQSIVHLELLRRDEYLTGTRRYPGLLTLDPPPHFSLLIVDEAHHLRNPETGSWELARFLCDQSEAAVFLSATPVHVGSQNLYTLLNLLRPDLFLDEMVFRRVIEPAPHLTGAMRVIRSQKPSENWPLEAAIHLEAAADTSWGRSTFRQDPRFAAWLEKMHDPNGLEPFDRVRCLRDLEEFHPLASVMNRTRRRDIGRFTVREPYTVSVPFTSEQQRFYDALIDFRRDMLALDYSPLVVHLILDTLERQAASCLPALAGAIDTFLRTGRFSITELTDDPEGEEVYESVPAELIEAAHLLREQAQHLPPDDPKLDRLSDVVTTSLEADGPGKVLVFSFFLRTLKYLREHLSESGYRVALITGQSEDEEREQLRRRFRLSRIDPDAIDVLLSSEVGCEGLDYEFCDRLVNYDIPWNPMRIEQRIGRIDRFGQKSDKVLIYNFITPGTIEERVFFRCFERLGVFRDTVGDLEAVLGDLVQDLNRSLLDPHLKPEQVEERARQLADNAVRRIDEQQRLEQESGALLGLDRTILDDVEALLEDGRFVSPDDLRTMIQMFLADPEIGGRLTPDERESQVWRLRLPRQGRSILLDKVRRLQSQDQSATALLRWLESNEATLPITFDQQIALERRELPFITPVHPLARVVVADWQNPALPLVGCFRASEPSSDVGNYLFVCDLWESIGVNPEIRLITSAVNLSTGQIDQSVSEVFLRLLARSKAVPEAPKLERTQLIEALDRLEEDAHGRLLEERRQFHLVNDLLIDRKLASLDAYFAHRVERVRQDIQRATHERITRMKEAELARIRRDHAEQRVAILGRHASDIISRRVAMGILTVEEETRNGR